MNLNFESILCLTMLVNNNSKTIVETLDSVINIIDTYCICDTGSTDDTISIIKEYFNKRNVKGKLFQKQYQNYLANNNILIKECIGLSKYLLLIEPDTKLININFDKNILLSNTQYSFNMITKYCDEFGSELNNELIIVPNKNNLEYIKIGQLLLQIDEPITNICLDKTNIYIEYLNFTLDNKNNLIKYEQEINNPNAVTFDQKLMFKLAKYYEQKKDYVHAISLYNKIIQFKCDTQDIWYANYKIGLCYKMLNNLDNAVKYWLESYNTLTTRVENIYHITVYYANIKKYNLAKLYYDIAKQNILILSDVEKKSLINFNEDIYNFKLYFEYNIFAYYANIRDINFEVNQIFNNIDSNFENMNIFNNATLNIYLANVMKNFKFYVKQIEYTNKILVDQNFHIPKILQNAQITIEDHIKIYDLFSKIDSYYIYSQIFASVQKQMLGEIQIYYNLNTKLTDTKIIFRDSVNKINDITYCNYLKLNNNVCIIKSWNPLKIYKTNNLNEIYININTPRIFKYITKYICVNLKEYILFLATISYDSISYYMFIKMKFDQMEFKNISFEYSYLFDFDEKNIENIGLCNNENKLIGLIYKSQKNLKIIEIDIKKIDLICTYS